MTDIVQTAFVEVRNTGSQDLRLALNSRITVIKPGQKAIVDREAASNLLGNWDLRDHPTDPLRKKRSEEYKRVRGLYGCMPGGLYEERYQSAEGHWLNRPIDIDRIWEERRPHAEVLVDGRPVVLVIDDPEGRSLPAEDTTGMDRDRLIAHLLAQQEQMSEMISRLEAENRVGQMPEVAEDSPDLNPVRRRKAHTLIPVDERDD